MLRGVYANSNPKKRQGKTGIKEDSGEVDGDLYGGGRRGAKQSVLTTLSLKQMQYNHLLYTALIWCTKISLYSPAGGYWCYFKFAHSSTQTKQMQSRIFI